MVTNRDRTSLGSRRKKFKFSHTTSKFEIFNYAFREFWTHFAESFRMSKSSWMMNPTRSREMPSCSATDLAEIRRSSTMNSKIWWIISGMVTVLGRPGQGAIQGEKAPRLNWATQFLTVIYDGACSPNVSVRMAPCLAGKKNLMRPRLSMLLKSRASPDMLLFSLCNKKETCNLAHEQPLFTTTLSITSYDFGK